MKKTIINLSALSLLLCTTGCATIFSGWKQRVKFESNPATATVVVDGVEIGKTPVSKKLLRRKTHQVKIKLDGFQDYETTLTRKVNAWVFGNIVIGGAVGALVDLATGAIYRLSEREVKATMNPNVVLQEQGADFFIGVTMQADPSWEKIGTLQKLDQGSGLNNGN